MVPSRVNPLIFFSNCYPSHTFEHLCIPRQCAKRSEKWTDSVPTPGANKQPLHPVSGIKPARALGAESKDPPSSAWWVRAPEFTQSKVGLLGTRIPWKSPPLPFFLVLGITQGRKLKLIRSQPRQKKHLGPIGPLALASEHANQPLSSHPLTQAISPAPPPPTPTVLSAASLPHLHSSLDIFFFLIFLNCACNKPFRKKSQEMRFRGRRWRTVGGGGERRREASSRRASLSLSRPVRHTSSPLPCATLSLDASHPQG